MAGIALDVSDATFERDVIERSRTTPVVVDFWAAWCGPCKSLGPILDDVAQRVTSVTLAKLDVDANPQSMRRFGIRGIPAVKGFRDGRVVDEFVGMQPKPVVEQFFARLAPVVLEDLPGDEAGLRDLLLRTPDRTEARRQLGRLLLQQHRVDDAEQVLAPGSHDAAVDGLLARAELLRDAAAVLPAPLATPNGRELTAVPAVIAAIRTADGDTRSRLRRVAVGALAENASDPEADLLRSQLASALF
jgi:putative thioredoxin